MENSNKTLVLVSFCALFMMIIAATTYFFGTKNKPLTSNPNTKDYVIASLTSGPACVSKLSGQVLWNCAGALCTPTEVKECSNSGNTYKAFLDEDEIIISDDTPIIKEQAGAVAGISDSACNSTGGGYTGQRGCLSGQKILVVGPPKVFSGSQNAPVDAGIFTKSASNNLSDVERAFNFSKNESVRFAVKVKNNSSVSVNDNFSFVVSKITQAPIGTEVTSNSLVCDVELDLLQRQASLTTKVYYEQTQRTYELKPNEVKMLAGQWQPTSKDCGLYKIELTADTFKNANDKICPSPNKPADNVIAYAYIRVTGEGCATTTSNTEVAKPSTCVYKPLSDWVEQSKAAEGQEINSPARLKTFTVPAGAEKRLVKVKYEFAPQGDKSSSVASVTCGAQANEEAAVQVVGENLLNRTYFGGYRFFDNDYKDTLFDQVTNPNPDPTVVKELNLMLPPGAYSITSKWQGDGQDFWNNALPDHKYYIDVRNKSKGMVTYSTAIADSAMYGPKCKWDGSYQIRASYCIVGSEAVQNAEMQKITVTIKNNDLVANTFFGLVYVNGVLLAQQDGNTQFEVKPGKTEIVEFVYQNDFPQSSVIEIVENINSNANGSVQSVQITSVESNRKLLDVNGIREITKEGIRLKFPQIK